MRRGHAVTMLTMLLLASACGGGAKQPSSAASPPGSPSPPAEPAPSLCQPSEPDCIGPLAPGIHTTANLITPVTFEVPDGWSKTLDVPGSVNLNSSAFPSGLIGILPDWAIANQTQCTPDPESGLGRTVDDLVTWLTQHPGLITSTPTRASLGGLDGQVLDLRKDPEWGGPCPGRVSLFTHVGTINDPGWWDVNDSARLRLYFLDAGDGHVVTVHVETGDEASFEAFVEAAAPIVESFHFVVKSFDFGATRSAPTPRGYAMMADLPERPGVLLLGGADAPGPPNLPDMWTFEPETGWQEITPDSLPEPVAGASGIVGNAFEFDSGSKKGVFVDIEGNTWAYDPADNTWEAKESKDGPTALLGTSMVYDAQSDRMILFGGLDLATFAENNETWAYDLDSNMWERMHPKRSPGPRNYYAMAYDRGSDRVIVFGGAPDGGAVGDTWAYDYDSDSWTEMSPGTSPAARTYSWMVYDPESDRMILFGGSEDQETAAFGDTWTYDFDMDVWTQLEIDGPAARAWHAMAYDAESGLVVLFGGGISRNEYGAETWIFDPSFDTWSIVP